MTIDPDPVIDTALIATKRTTFEYDLAEGYDALAGYGTDELIDICAAHETHHNTVNTVESALEEYEVPYETVAADELADQHIQGADVVFSVGGDGTVLDTAKHLDDEVLVPIRSDGASRGGLCRYGHKEAADAITDIATETYAEQAWTRIETDRDETPALNEIYIGAQDATDAARYEVDGERIQSSGMIVASGAGSTGWYANINGGNEDFAPETDELRVVHREPIGADPGVSVIAGEESVTVRSEMNGHKDPIIRYDGDKDRTVPFPRGETVEIALAETPVRVAVPEDV